MRRLRRGPIAAIVLLLALSACGRGVFREPEVTLQNVQLAGLGLRGGTLLVNLEIINPNAFSLSTNRLDYELAIAESGARSDTVWVDLASGTHEERFSVGGGDTASVQVPVEFTYAGLSGAAASLLRAGSFSYRATGTVDLRTPLGSHAVPFRRRGMVSVLGSR